MGRDFRCVIVFCAVMAVIASFGAQPAHANSKYAAIVIHAESGDVILDDYSTSYRYPASLTKMMTLYMLFDELESGRLTLDSDLKVSARAAGQPPSKLGVTAGSTIKVETAINALVVKSANDVAAVVGEAISGSEWKFATAMTTKARSLGMRRTTFRNASGLPNTKQKTTAKDLAILSQRLMQDFPQYYGYFANKSFVWNGRTYRTHNNLVKTFDGADGLKTGYTRLSGFNLATSATRDGERLIGIVLGGRSVRTRDAHMKKILEEAFAKVKKRPSMIASLHRNTPSPRLKPTLMAELALTRGAPTVASNTALQNEIANAAASLQAYAADTDNNGSNNPLGLAQTYPQERDAIGNLITTVSSDDFNQFERVLLAGFDDGEELGQGDMGEIELRDWSVQIGAYSQKPLAQKELEAAAIAANLTEHHRVVSPIVMKDGSMLFRARFASLTEEDASEMCEAVRAAKLKCFTLRETASE